MIGPEPVVVALSTFNGAKHVTAQIASIRGQTFDRWRLLVRDDGSTDGTVALVEAAARADPRIELVRDGLGNLGPAGSYGVLLERAAAEGAPRVALCDQDDVWRADKLARGLALMAAREAELGDGVPLLVHSDLTVVDAGLGVIHSSFVQYQGVRPVADRPLRKLLVQNFVTGCTALVNRALLDAAVPVPRRVIMHDWWLALCAAALGEVLYLPEATVLYRQHGANTLGSRSRRRAGFESVRRPISWWRHSSRLFAEGVAQASELRRRVRRVAGTAPATRPAAAHALAMLDEYCAAFAGAGPWQRLRTIRRWRIRPGSLLPYPVCFYCRVLLWPRHTAAAPGGER